MVVAGSEHAVALAAALLAAEALAAVAVGSVEDMLAAVEDMAALLVVLPVVVVVATMLALSLLLPLLTRSPTSPRLVQKRTRRSMSATYVPHHTAADVDLSRVLTDGVTASVVH